jgi:hypothetical protein
VIHDPDLLDRLSGLPIERFDGEAFRATRANLHPLAFSTRGGRWAPQDRAAVLYTSLAREGALAEIAHHWGRLTPTPDQAGGIAPLARRDAADGAPSACRPSKLGH